MRTEPPPPPSALEALAPGSTLAIRRPTPGVALLSLWIDAGSRNSSPPQVATAAALWAAQQANAAARVLPDGTEISLLCDTRSEGVMACGLRLLRALSPPPVREPDLVMLRERLRTTRRRALADAARRADALALESLLGEAARPLDPLGAADDDARVETGLVQQFLDRNYAVSRSLLVGVGDLEKSQLDELFAGRGAPPVTPPPSRMPLLLPTEPPSVRVEIGDLHRIALALPAASRARAASVCERFLQVHTSATARISQLNGLVIAHLSMPTGEVPWARLQSAVFDLQRILIEGGDTLPLPPPDGLSELARQVGETWIARGTRSAGVPTKAGVALIVARDDASDKAADTALSALRERAQQAVAQGMANSAGAIQGHITDLSARVTTANGAHVEVVRRPGDGWFAAALRLSGGSGEDPPTAHGRAALLASLLADGCGFSAGRTLDVWLTTLQARLSPLLDAEGVGILISAPARHAEAALDTLLRCAVRPSFSARAVEDARARLLRSLWKRDDAQLHATLGSSLVPSAPGMVAHWGTPDGVAKVDASGLRRLHDAHSKGPLISVWVAADRPPAELARFVSRRLAHLPAEVAPQERAALGPRSDIGGAFTRDARVRVVIGLRTSSGERASNTASLFASALSDALAKRVGQPLWAWGGSSSGLSVAGVALTLREDELDSLPAHTDAALQELAKRPEASFRGAHAALMLSQAAALSSARGWAAAAFHGRASVPEESSEIQTLVRKLAAERPSFFVLRPRP